MNMTTTVKVNCNGNYVAEVRQDDREVVNVGPGSMVEKSFYFPHPGPSSFVITERPATPEEIEAAKPKTEAA
jgi:hypothetical protein